MHKTFRYRIAAFSAALFVLSFPAGAYSDHRGHNLDSLEKVVAPWTGEAVLSAPDSVFSSILGAYADLMNGYLQINTPRCLYYAHRALDLADSRNCLNTAVSARKIIGQVFWAQEQYDSAAVYYSSALADVDRMAAGEVSGLTGKPYPQEDVEDGYSKLYGTLGNLYNMMDSIPLAMEYYAKAGEIFDRNGWNESNSVLYYNIGETWVGEGEYRKAREAYERSLEYGRTAGDSLLIANALKGLGGLYLDMGKTSRALRCLKEADGYYSLHDDQEFRYRMETLDFMGKVLSQQKKTRTWLAVAAFFLLALLLALQLLLKRMRHLAKEKKAADEVIDEALESISRSDESGDAPVKVIIEGDTPELSDREQSILPLLASGMTSQQIADKLCLSLPTIKWYRKKLMDKFGASNTADLIFKAKECGRI